MSEQLPFILLEAALRATALWAMVGVLLWLLRVPRGALRHSAWLMVVVAMLLMPALQRLAPALPLPVSPRVPEVRALFEPQLPPVAPAPGPARPDPATASNSPTGDRYAAALAPVARSIATDSPIRWMAVAGAAYALVALALLLRLLVALRTVRAIVRGARPLDDGLWESAMVVTPVTVGIVRPRILLPTSWTTWPETTREAVVAHERAHASRRDPLVALLARFNACIFWFHPLAWWLERTVADAAEHACDQAAVRTVSHPREYAEALLTMATASRRAGGRIAWAGVRAEGSGHLSDRLDTILEGKAVRPSSARRWLALAGCMASVIVVVACQSEKVVEPLLPYEIPGQSTEQREAAQLENQRRESVRKAAHAMTWAEAEALQAAWRRNPEDLATVEKLLFFYEPDVSGKHTPDDAKKIAGRRPLILWLIEHHPDSELIRQIPGRIFPPGDWLPDLQGYEAAKKLWLAHAARPDVTANTLRTAAAYLNVRDKPIAERLLLQGQRKYPDVASQNGPWSTWSSALGRLYAEAILGSNRFTLFNVVHSTSAEEARGAYALKVRTILDTTNDPVILARAGDFLISNARQSGGNFDRQALARIYLTRALQLDPRSIVARSALERMNALDEAKQEQALFAGVALEARPEVIAKLPEDQRLPILAKQASFEAMIGRARDWEAKEAGPGFGTENHQKARAAWQRSVKYAQDALDLAKRLPQHPDQADAVFSATVVLGLNAFREGDRQTAVRHMLAAAEVPPSTSGRLRSPILNMSREMGLIGGLLKYGERETVIQYFERSAERRPADRERLLAAAAAIRKGREPIGYERR